MSSSGRLYQGESAESRTKTRRQQLIDTGFELMASDDWRNVSINQLCREAKLNKRYFYESFTDLAALEDAVVDDLTSNLLTVGLSAAATAQQGNLSTEALAKHVMNAVIQWLVGDRRRPKVLFGGASGNPRAQAHRKAVIRHLAGELSAFGRRYHAARESVTAAHPGAPIAVAASALLIGGSIELLLGWLDGDLDAPLEDVVDYIASFWVAIGSDAVKQTKRRMKSADDGAKSRRGDERRATGNRRRATATRTSRRR